MKRWEATLLRDLLHGYGQVISTGVDLEELGKFFNCHLIAEQYLRVFIQRCCV